MRTPAVASVLLSAVLTGWLAAAPPTAGAGQHAVSFPTGRTAYFAGEKVLMVVEGQAAGATVAVELLAADGRVAVYRGKAGTLLLDTGRLAPGEYGVAVDGQAVPDVQLHLAPIERRSAASLQDESFPGDEPRLTHEDRKDPAACARKLRDYQAEIAGQMRQIGLSACMNMMAAGMGRRTLLDGAARSGVLLMANPDTRPTSFCPVHVDPVELDGMTQRMLLTVQANGRYPNFGGFCVGFDPCGHKVGGRRMLLTYWQWNKNTEPLKHYLQHEDDLLKAEFHRRTGYDWVTPEDYIAYLLAIRRPDLAPIIDLPTKRWLEETSAHVPAIPPDKLAAFEKRLDAWSGFLMERYRETYGRYVGELQTADASLRHTASVQIDHAPTLEGQYFPAAYAPLDFRYQSTWNDQVGGADYSYQPLFTAGLLNMERPDEKPIWISTVHATVFGHSPFPGHLARVAAHILPQGATGLGFACEGFSTLLGGMNPAATWERIRGTPGEFDVAAGREFMDRFVCLATEGRGAYGVGVLFSKTQLGRQHLAQCFGTPQFKTFVALTRLGYTPVYLTEDQIARREFRGVAALAVVGQTAPLPDAVSAGLAAFVAAGGQLIADRSSTSPLPSCTRVDASIPVRHTPGKVYNWSAPNLPPGKNATFVWDDIHRRLAPAFDRALDGRGHAALRAARGAETQLTLLQIDGGHDAAYVLAVNDSFVSSQADWRVIREQLTPAATTDERFLYDLTEERSLGRLRPFRCDLDTTTVRVYGIVARELGPIDLRCRQRAAAGERVPVSVSFVAKDGRGLAGVFPLEVTLVRPDGKPQLAWYRGTDRQGKFAAELPLPVNVPEGTWKVEVRCQLDGRTASLPIEVARGNPRPLAAAVTGPVVVRDKEAIDGALVRGARFVLPLFAKQQELAGVAQEIKTRLAAQGVTVEIRPAPEMATYWLAYELTPEQEAENRRVEAGETIGRIKRTTANGNDWYAAQSGYRCASPLILLDVAGAKDNEMAQSLESAGMLWPEVSHAFPGPGRAVVQCVRWAFGPRTPAIVIQAADAEGLHAAATRLTSLPEDFLTPSVRAARAGLFRQLHVGGRPEGRAAAGLTAEGLTSAVRPQPFRIRFGEAKPFAADQPPVPGVVPSRPPLSVPGIAMPEDYSAQLRVDDGYVPASGPSGKGNADLRFSDAVALDVELKHAGPLAIAVEGVFRYNDRPPCNAPQWEDVLALRARYYRVPRQPIRFDVLVDGQPAGVLDRAATGQQDVQLELYAPSGQKPKSASEEVVVEVAGVVRLAAGRHTILFVPQNVTDGQLNRVRLGTEKSAADALEQAIRALQAEQKKRQDEERKRKAAKK